MWLCGAVFTAAAVAVVAVVAVVGGRPAKRTSLLQSVLYAIRFALSTSAHFSSVPIFHWDTTPSPSSSFV